MGKVDKQIIVGKDAAIFRIDAIGTTRYTISFDGFGILVNCEYIDRKGEPLEEIVVNVQPVNERSVRIYY